MELRRLPGIPNRHRNRAPQIRVMGREYRKGTHVDGKALAGRIAQPMFPIRDAIATALQISPHLLPLLGPRRDALALAIQAQHLLVMLPDSRHDWRHWLGHGR